MSQPKILVVDDDPDFVEAMHLTLEPNGYTVVSAASGDEGLAKVSSESPDLVILDVIMSSVLDGLQMSRRMQQNPEHKKVPILMVTSIANTDYAASGHGAAGDKWLVAYCASPFVLAMGTATSSTVGVGLAAGTWPFRITHTGVDADDTPHVQSSVAAAVVRLTWMRDLVL